MRKGLTPVIAMILLLMMTVAAAGASFYWLLGLQGELQGSNRVRYRVVHTPLLVSLHQLGLPKRDEYHHFHQCNKHPLAGADALLLVEH